MSSLRIIPLGGLGEIGMNCMALEYKDEIIVIDCGVLFSDLDHFGVSLGIPDFSYLEKRKEKVKAFLVTHGHEDHIGALPFAIRKGFSAPVYASGFSLLLIQAKLKEHGIEGLTDLQVVNGGTKLKFKHFSVSFVPVNHSIVDSMALIIDTPVGKIIHTGDFKIDSAPFFGSMMDMDIFSKAGEEGVLLLMSDSTNVEQHNHNLGEDVVYQKFEQLFTASKGLVVVSMFASNIGRMGQVFDLAKKLNKKIALAGRTMEQNVSFGIQTGYLKDASSTLIKLDDLKKYKRNNLIVLSTGSQGEDRSALIRISTGEHSHIKLSKDDLVLVSAKFIPGNERAIGKMINHLFQQGAEVLYEAVHGIHVSGHATRPELKEMIERVKPRFFIPIHGEYRHLVHHAKLAQESGLKPQNVLIAVNGDVIECSSNQCRVVEKLKNTVVLLEDRKGSPISNLVLRDRKKMAEKGVVFSCIVRDKKTGRVLLGPELFSKGLTHEDREGWIVSEAKKMAGKIAFQYQSQQFKNESKTTFEEAIRVELRRFFKQNLGRKPLVYPIIINL